MNPVPRLSSATGTADSVIAAAPRSNGHAVAAAGHPTHTNAAAVSAEVHERIYRLWDELATFEASRSEDALMYLLAGVAALVDAQNAYWMGAVRMQEDDDDPLRGWRPRLIRYLHPLVLDQHCEQRVKSLRRGGRDELAEAHARLAGTFRSCRMRDLVGPEWFDGPTYQSYRSRNLHDALVIAVPITPTVEGYYGFLRMREGDPFTEAQRDVGFTALRGLAWFHRQILLTHGLGAAGAPLSPTERRVLALLLTEKPEKAIAEEMAVTTSTLHTYVRAVLRKLGVSGRNGLISLWLGRQT